MSEEITGEDTAPDPRFDDELRAVMEGNAPAGLREPSAREREKLAKTAHAERERQERRLAKLRQETARQARNLDKATRRQQRETGSRRRRRQQLRWAASIVVLGALAIAYVHFAHSPGPSAGGPNDTRAVTNGAVPPETPATLVSPLTASGPPADPFQGTPADKWANGAAGIVIPAAARAGRYSAAQVESAYQTTKKMLLAAALDRQTLLGGAPTAFADLLTPQERTYFVSHLDNTAVDKNGVPQSSRYSVISFAPGTTKFVTTVFKVHGNMKARAATDGHGNPVLVVDIDYLLTYAVEPPRAPTDWMRIVAHFYGPVEFGNWSGATTSFAPWWLPTESAAGGRCSSHDGFIHPDYPTGPEDSVQPSGRPINPYSLAKPPSGCTATTGT